MHKKLEVIVDNLQTGAFQSVFQTPFFLHRKRKELGFIV